MLFSELFFLSQKLWYSKNNFLGKVLCERQDTFLVSLLSVRLVNAFEKTASIRRSFLQIKSLIQKSLCPKPFTRANQALHVCKLSPALLRFSCRGPTFCSLTWRGCWRPPKTWWDDWIPALPSWSNQRAACCYVASSSSARLWAGSWLTCRCGRFVNEGGE